MKTMILDEQEKKVDLGDEATNEAYEGLEQLRETYIALGKNALDAVVQLREKGPRLITAEDQERLEPLLNDAEAAKARFGKADQLLNAKFEQFASECETMGRDTKRFEKHVADGEDALRLVKSLLQEGHSLRVEKKLTDAITKLYEAREALAYIVQEAKRNWVENAYERARTLVGEGY